MLRIAKSLEGFAIQAKDGRVGHVHDVYIDDRHWVIRHLVVDTGGWLVDRKVLLSPASGFRLDWDSRSIQVPLTRDQVENSPDWDSEMPVSRQHEIELFKHYNWPYYWGGTGLWGAVDVPRFPTEPPSDLSYPPQDITPEGQEANPHLRSVRDLRGYHIQSPDGEFGHVVDFILDDGSWQLRYAVVDTKNWWPSKAVLIATDWVTQVSWSDEKLFTDLRKEQIQHAPPFDWSKPLSRSFEEQLYQHYGRERPWTSTPGLTTAPVAEETPGEETAPKAMKKGNLAI